jgi:hypothetical protein
MRHADPEFAPCAVEDLQRLGVIRGRKLKRELRRLANGWVSGARVTVLASPAHEPPWQSVRFGAEITVVFRALSEAERPPNPVAEMLVAGIATPDRLQAVLDRLAELD